MSKIFASLLMVVFLISCNKDDQTGNQEPNNPLTESLVELGIKLWELKIKKAPTLRRGLILLVVPPGLECMQYRTLFKHKLFIL